VALTIGTVILVAYLEMEIGKIFVQWQTSRFIHVMSLILPLAYCFQHSGR